MKLRRQILSFAVALLVFAPSGWAKDLALVVTKTSALKTVTTSDIAKAMKTPAPKWADGKDMIFVIKAPSSNEAKIFGTKVLGQAPEAVSGFLTSQKKNFIIVNTDAELFAALAANPNAIGVMDIYSINGNVAVVKVDGKLPLEPGYLLHYN
jgi:ABC-type phosphate transport system substrate-binding protein